MTAAIQQRAGLTPPRPSPADSESPVGLEYARVFAFLSAIRSVYAGDACLTEVGAEYLGITFRFPTSVEQAPSEPPAEVRHLRVVGS